MKEFEVKPSTSVPSNFLANFLGSEFLENRKKGQVSFYPAYKGEILPQDFSTSLPSTELDLLIKEGRSFVFTHSTGKNYLLNYERSSEWLDIVRIP